MIYQILMAVAGVVIILGTLLTSLLRKKQPSLSTRYWDFISIAAFFFGGFALINILYNRAGTNSEVNDMVTKVLLVAFPTVLTVFFIIYLVFFFWKGGINSRVGNDERTEISGTKSARNALLATNLALFIYLGSSQTLNRSALLIILFSGYFVYLASLIFYYYFKA